MCTPSVDAQPYAFAVLLHDELGERMPGALCRVGTGVGTLRRGTLRADSTGWLVVEVPHRPKASILILWAPAGARPGDERYPYYAQYHVLLDEDGDDPLRRRLANLGYAHGATVEDNVRAFERDYELPPTGTLTAISSHLVAYHDMAQLPSRRNGALTPPSPAPPSSVMAPYLPYGGGGYQVTAA